MSGLAALFAPGRVAVRGVSGHPRKLGHVLLKNVLAGGFPGEVFVVNPGGQAILGAPTVPRARDLPADIDLALISLPPAAVLEAVRELGARGTRMAVILTSGFGEVNPQGRAEQAALLEAARAGGLRLVGPNCMGVYSRAARLNGTYFWELPDAPGQVGVVSQSGAYGGLIMRHLGGQGIGVSRFLSIGNQVDLEIADALEFLAEDEDTRLVACFIEAVRDGRRFVEAAARVTARKPMVVLKGGRSESGRRAAGSHTGSLAGQAEVYQAAFRSAGIVACAETEEFFDAIQALATTSLRPARPTLAVITVSGGPSVVAADTAEAAGLEVPATSADVQSALRRVLPGFAAVGNPVDLTPQVSPEQIAVAVSHVLKEDVIAGVVAIDVGLDIAEFATGLVGAGRASAKPVVACAVDAPAVIETFARAGVPVYPTPERAIRAYRALWAASRSAPATMPHEPRTLPEELRVRLDGAGGPLPYETARDILTAYGVCFCRDGCAGSIDEAVTAADALGYPVVIKSVRPDLLHKTEAGAVITGLTSPDQVRGACELIAERVGAAAAFLVQEQVPAGIELLVGARRDPAFGPIALVGTGGFFAEALRDVSIALAPLSAPDALALVRQGLRARLLDGYRGLPPASAEPVARVLTAVGDLLLDHPRIAELDLNPLIVRGETAVAVDALLILGD